MNSSCILVSIELASVQTTGLLQGSSILSSFDTIEFSAVTEASEVECEVNFGGQTLPCANVSTLQLTQTSENLTVTVSVATDEPILNSTFVYQVLYLPCQLQSIDASSPTPFNCSRNTTSLACLMTENPEDAANFNWQYENCANVMLLAYVDSEWQVTYSNTTLAYGVNQYQLIYETYSTPSRNVSIFGAEIAYSKSHMSHCILK